MVAIQLLMAMLDSKLPVSSSKPPALPPEQIGLFRDVLELLNARGVPYAISGAFALHEHTGIWRDTKDLDLFLTVPDANLALQHLRENGFDCEIRDSVWLAKAHRGEYFVDLITGMSNAAIVVAPSWIERSTSTKLFGIRTRVLAAEELLASKLFVLFRERFDGADMVHLIYGTRGRLEWKRVLELVGEHRDLLLSILVLFNYAYPSCGYMVSADVWELLIDGLKQTIANPDPESRFRGTLLDENMFAIDVKEWGFHDLMEEYRKRRQPRMQEQVEDDVAKAA